MENYYNDGDEPNYETVYEILDSINNEYVMVTKDRDIAEQHHEKGYLIDEHRLQKMKPTSNVTLTTVATIHW